MENIYGNLKFLRVLYCLEEEHNVPLSQRVTTYEPEFDLHVPVTGNSPMDLQARYDALMEREVRRRELRESAHQRIDREYQHCCDGFDAMTHEERAEYEKTISQVHEAYALAGELPQDKLALLAGFKEPFRVLLDCCVSTDFAPETVEFDLLFRDRLQSGARYDREPAFLAPDFGEPEPQTMEQAM